MPPVCLWVCMFSLLCLKGFADFSSWKYEFVEFLSPASIGGIFFLGFWGGGGGSVVRLGLLVGSHAFRTLWPST
jgi:hypothetical protein